MHQTEATKECQRQISKLTSKNSVLFNALDAQLRKIKENPHRFKPLGNILAGLRRVHVLKCFVLVVEFLYSTADKFLRKFVLTYDIDEPSQKVIHHDEAY